ncbi:MAG TPA: hypothetical protein VH641_14880 [Streptosporangiaceae bacterium]
MTPSAPVEGKVVASGAYGALSLVLTWILTTYVFRGHVPPDLLTFLPGFVSLVAGAAAGWLARHTPRLDEVAAEVAQVVGAQLEPPKDQ